MKALGCLLSLVMPLLAEAGPVKWFDPRAAAPPPAFGKVVLGKVPPELLKPPTEEYRLGPGDKLEIEVMEVPYTRQLCFVMPDGYIYFQTLDGVKVNGMTVPQLKAKLEEGLLTLYKHPQVSVVVRGVSSQRVWVLGRVNLSGLYPLDSPTTVLEAISRAGGLFSSGFSGTTEELADLTHSFLVRDGKMMPVDFFALLKKGDMSQNVYLKSGDYIYLPSSLSKEVYVLGAVVKPQALGFSDGVTVISAISAARGFAPSAYPQKALIIRGTLTSPSVAIVNVKEILAAKAPDVKLEPRDIIWIPNSPWDRLGNLVKNVVDTFTRTVAANEGSRAVSREAAPVQSNISINPSTAR